jgi:hypothetical protein
MDEKHKRQIKEMIEMYTVETIARQFEVAFRAEIANGSSDKVNDKCAAVLFSNAAYEAAELSI